MALPLYGVLSDTTVPAKHLRAVTPSAEDDLPDGPCRALYIGGGGDISVIAEGDIDVVTLVGIPSGYILLVSVKAVRITGTNATNIVALY